MSQQPTSVTVPSSQQQSPLRQILTPLLLIFGVQLWLLIGGIDYGIWMQRRFLIVAAVLSMLPPLYRPFTQLLDRLRQPSCRAAMWTAVAIALLSALYLPFTAWYQGRSFAPKWQDEMSYLIQIRMLAQGGCGCRIIRWRTSLTRFS